ncbi:hypothetical protein ACWGLE_21000 [Streptomyces sp. NPDC055897]
MLYLALAFTREEQAVQSQTEHTLSAAPRTGASPSLQRAAPYMEDIDFAERFDFGLSLILDSLKRG